MLKCCERESLRHSSHKWKETLNTDIAWNMNTHIVQLEHCVHKLHSDHENFEAAVLTDIYLISYCSCKLSFLGHILMQKWSLTFDLYFIILYFSAMMPLNSWYTSRKVTATSVSFAALISRFYKEQKSHVPLLLGTEKCDSGVQPTEVRSELWHKLSQQTESAVVVTYNRAKRRPEFTSICVKLDVVAPTNTACDICVLGTAKSRE